MKYGIIKVKRAFLYEENGVDVVDEVFFGWSVMWEDKGEWIEVWTHYGYRGWMERNLIEEKSREWQRNPGFPDKKRKRNFGISASSPWQTGKSGRIDRACLGCLRGQLQRIHPRPYVFSSPKAQGGTWIRSDFK